MFFTFVFMVLIFKVWFYSFCPVPGIEPGMNRYGLINNVGNINLVICFAFGKIQPGPQVRRLKLLRHLPENRMCVFWKSIHYFILFFFCAFLDSEMPAYRAICEVCAGVVRHQIPSLQERGERSPERIIPSVCGEAGVCSFPINYSIGFN